MSSIASLLTGGPVVSAQGNRGKASSNSQGDEGGFAKQLSENKTAKCATSQNAQNSSILTEENGGTIDIEMSLRSLRSQEKIKLDHEFKSDVYPATPIVELQIDKLEFSSDLDLMNDTNSTTKISSNEIAIPIDDLASNLENIVLKQSVEQSALTPEIETVTRDQGILAALNTHLNTQLNNQLGEQLDGKLSIKAQASENAQIKLQLNEVNVETVTPIAKSSVDPLATHIDTALKSESADIIELNKGITKSSDIAAVSPSIQNIDAPKANNTQNVEAAKLPANATILANLANGDGLSDKGGDQQRGGGSNQLVNQVDKAGIKIEGVEVLEARVFPAISQSNGTNIADALLKTRQLGGSSALQNSEPIYNISQPKMMNTLKIQLVPANLGVVTAVMTLTGEDLQVQLQVDNVEAYRKLSSDSASIVNTLKNQGFSIEQVNVQLMNGDKGSVQQGQQQNGQSFQGQAQQEASSSFDRDHRDPNSNEQNQELGNNESDILQAPQITDLSNGVYL